MTEDNDLILLDRLSKTFGDRTILNKVSLNLHQGEIVGLIGPSGAGKSTMIKVMLGMEKPMAERRWFWARPCPTGTSWLNWATWRRPMPCMKS